MSTLKTVEELVKSKTRALLHPGVGLLYVREEDAVELLTQDRHSLHTSLVAAVKGLDTKFVPGDSKWFGKNDYSEGEYKLVPAKDPNKAMYCLTCERFLPEEGCTCGTVSVERVLTIINSIFKE